MFLKERSDFYIKITQQIGRDVDLIVVLEWSVHLSFIISWCMFTLFIFLLSFIVASGRCEMKTIVSNSSSLASQVHWLLSACFLSLVLCSCLLPTLYQLRSRRITNPGNPFLNLAFFRLEKCSLKCDVCRITVQHYSLNSLNGILDEDTKFQTILLIA